MSPCSLLMSVPPIPAQPPSPPPAAQLPPSMPLSRPPKMITACAMTTRVANNLDSGPSLIETHPNHEKWPEWIVPCVKALERMCEGLGTDNQRLVRVGGYARVSQRQGTYFDIYP